MTTWTQCDIHSEWTWWIDIEWGMSTRKWMFFSLSVSRVEKRNSISIDHDRFKTCVLFSYAQSLSLSFLFDMAVWMKEAERHVVIKTTCKAEQKQPFCPSHRNLSFLCIAFLLVAERRNSLTNYDSRSKNTRMINFVKVFVEFPRFHLNNHERNTRIGSFTLPTDRKTTATMMGTTARLTAVNRRRQRRKKPANNEDSPRNRFECQIEMDWSVGSTGLWTSSVSLLECLET